MHVKDIFLCYSTKIVRVDNTYSEPTLSDGVEARGQWAEAFSSGLRAASIAGVVYLAFAAAKLILGYLLGSIAVEADGVHTLADSLTALAVYIGLRLARERPTSKFPFGLYKAENLAALVVSVAIGAAAVEIAWESIRPRPLVVGDPLLLIALESASAVVYYGLASYLRRSRGSIFSSLSAEAAHAFQDVLISIVVVVGVLGQVWGYMWIPSAVGLGISIFILYQAYLIGKSSILTLLDAGDVTATSRIEEIVTRVPGVVGVHDIRTRRAGPFLMASMHLETSPAISVRDADAIADRVEEILRAKMPDLLMVTIHEEPGRPSSNLRVAVFEDSSGYVADRAADAEKILIVDPSGATEEIPNPAPGGPMRNVASMLEQKGVSVAIIGEAGHERLMAFRASGIDIYRSPHVPAIDAVERFRNGELRRSDN
ncbi:Cobalt-zinc-cadmium resistance protein [Conexivisphaera calida]|uniref:Cobalt-zinc-cadmium resistance protein n=1 Tax=Conexivisphaera calida TaxID=1874277 RepID=A0A4V0P1P9_9ARCH|nr:Cobalt-zinc-cadmium resistance protein [Conexivisphaera calida]